MKFSKTFYFTVHVISLQNMMKEGSLSITMKRTKILIVFSIKNKAKKKTSRVFSQMLNQMTLPKITFGMKTKTVFTLKTFQLDKC